MWQCFADRSPGGVSCGHFSWAEFDEDGRPPWVENYKGNVNVAGGVVKSDSKPED